MSKPLSDEDQQSTFVVARDKPGNPAVAQRLLVHTHGMTDPGRVRPSNEDHFLIAELAKALRVHQSSLPQPRSLYSDERGYLFLVADGMGGHRAGEQASALAIATVEAFVLNTQKWFFHLKGSGEQDVLLELQNALRQADARVFQEARKHPEFAGMGTTLTLGYCIDGELFVVHVGDSRCYLLRAGKLHQLTHDHTIVGEMVRKGCLEPDEAAHHQFRHVITNAVGGNEPGIKVENHKLHLEAGDVLLLCSDGLSEMVAPDQILDILQRQTSPQTACERLVAEANAQGGRDNITVIVTRFEPDGQEKSQ